MSGLSIRLTHKIMAIGIVGLIGLLAFGAIYRMEAGLRMRRGPLLAKVAPFPIWTSKFRSRCWRRVGPRRIFSSAATSPTIGVIPNYPPESIATSKN